MSRFSITFILFLFTNYSGLAQGCKNNYINPENQKSWWDGLEEVWKINFNIFLGNGNKIDKPSSLDNLFLEKKISFNLIKGYEKVNNLSGLACLTNLMELEVDGILETDADISAVSNLHKLVFFNASNNTIKDFKPINSLQNLAVLILNNTNLETLIKFDSLSSLITIECENTQLKSLNGVENMLNLREIYAPRCNISNIDAINGLPFLDEIFCGSNKIENVKLSSKSLSFINIDDNQLTTLKGFSGLPITALFCNNNNIASLDGLQNMYNLTDIRMWGNPIKSFEDVDSINSLQSIDFAYSKQLKSTKGINKWINLKELYIHDCDIDTLIGIDSLKKLKILSLTNNKNLKSLTGISSLLNLKELHVDNCQIPNPKDIAALYLNKESKKSSKLDTCCVKFIQKDFVRRKIEVKPEKVIGNERTKKAKKDKPVYVPPFIKVKIIRKSN